MSMFSSKSIDVRSQSGAMRSLSRNDLIKKKPESSSSRWYSLRQVVIAIRTHGAKNPSLRIPKEIDGMKIVDQLGKLVPPADSESNWVLKMERNHLLIPKDLTNLLFQRMLNNQIVWN